MEIYINQLIINHSMDILTVVIIICLVVCSALFSGLTLGLMSLNPFSLRRKVKLGDKDAMKIYPLRKKGNLLLSTLLLGNVMVNAALSIFLGSMTTGIAALVIATGLIVLFGEILPQALFARYALKLGARMVWFVYIFFFILYPVTKPLSLGLDKLFGGELPKAVSKKEFRIMFEEQATLDKSDLDKDEMKILKGGLGFSDKTVKDVMTPRVNIFFIEQDSPLTKQTLNRLHSQGHSRVPVYDKVQDKVVGILYSKDLITVDPHDKILVKKVMRKKVQFIKETAKLDDVMNLFKQKKIHLFVVLDDFKGIAGIITLEDVLEEIVGEIVDEYDRIADMRRGK